MYPECIGLRGGDGGVVSGCKGIFFWPIVGKNAKYIDEIQADFPDCIDRQQ